MRDVKCPYCSADQEINHDDNYGYDEDTRYPQECTECGKIFVFTTEIILQHEAYKADCLNDSDHKYQATDSIPKEYTKMRCVDCGEERPPTLAEIEEIMRGKKS